MTLKLKEGNVKFIFLFGQFFLQNENQSCLLYGIDIRITIESECESFICQFEI